MFNTLSFGELLWDLFPDYKKPGGSPANLAYHLHLFKNRSYLLSRVGTDPNGDELLKFISNKGISSRYIQRDPQLPTGLVTVAIDEENEPTYTIHQPAAWDEIEFTPDLSQLTETLDAFCFASLSQRNNGSMNTVHTLLKKLPNHCLKVFDLNIRRPFVDNSTILKNIAQSDVIKFNREEYSIVGEWLGTKDTADKIIEMDSNKTVLLTLGSEGSELFNSKGRFHHKAYPIGGKGDFVGVGDAFLACFTHLKLKEIEPQQLLELSNRYAAFVASQKGSMPDIPQELIELII
jgi:fructokinase